MKIQKKQYSKKGELRTFKMICSTFGHLFNFIKWSVKPIDGGVYKKM